MADDRYLNAVPRDDLRAHLGPLPAEPVAAPSAGAAAQPAAERVVAEEWLAETIRTHLLGQVGHGPRHRGVFLPLGAVPAWADEDDAGMVFTVRMGGHALEVAVRSL